MKIKRFKNESGAVVVIVALSIVALMMVTALTIDVGSLYEERRHLQTVADAAALAGAQELPEDKDGAIEKAIDYASYCGFDIDYDDVEISFRWVEDDTITVNVVNPNAPLYFARVIGISQTQVAASATAMIASPVNINNVVPWGASIPEGTDWVDWLEPGEDKILKFGAEESEKGKFYALSLSGEHEGTDVYRDRIIDGFDQPLKVGDLIYPKTGVMAQVTVDATNTRVVTWDPFESLVTYDEGGDVIKLAKGDTQFVIVPVIYEFFEGEPPGASEPIEIVAFAPFILVRIEGQGGHAEIVGKFIHQVLIVTSGKVGGVEPVGLRVIRLID